MRVIHAEIGKKGRRKRKPMGRKDKRCGKTKNGDAQRTGA